MQAPFIMYMGESCENIGNLHIHKLCTVSWVCIKPLKELLLRENQEKQVHDTNEG